MKQMQRIVCLVALLLTFFSLNAQKKPMSIFEPQWTEIEKSLADGRTKDAANLANLILEKARKTGSDAEVMRTLLYVANLQKVEEEEVDKAPNIVLLEKELASAKMPLKAMLESYTAQAYSQYYRNKRWQIDQRTAVSAELTIKDIATWDGKRFIRRINELFLASIGHSESADVLLDKVLPIVDNREDADGMAFHPSLQDVLLDKALAHFENSNMHLDEAADKFALNMPEAFADAKAFANYTFTSKDVHSGLLQSVKIFQDYTKRALASGNIGRLLFVSQRRLNFMLRESVWNKKNEAYEKALLGLVDAYNSNEFITEIYHDLAVLERGRSTDKATNIKKAEATNIKKALAWIEKAEKAFPKSSGTNRCSHLKSEIKTSNLGIRTEHYWPKGENALVQITYKNINKTTLQLAQVDEAFLTKLHSAYEAKEQIRLLKTLKYTKPQTLAIPNENDYVSYTTEAQLDLPNVYGTYLVVASENAALEQSEHVRFFELQVTDLAVAKYSTNASNTVRVLNRLTGEGISGAKVNIYKQEYSRQSNKYEKIKLHEGLTTANGLFKMPAIGENQSIIIEAEYKTDKLPAFSEHIYRERHHREATSIRFYLDRAIYRPGQTVYFKGLVYDNVGENKFKIMPNFKTTVTLNDANYQKIGDLTLTTNEYGTFQGSFSLPLGGLTGSFNLVALNSSQHFQVEEYKRPKFEVKYPELTKAYKLNDKVKVVGNAVAFSGAKIDGAKVTYRVERKPYYPNFPWWRCGWDFWNRLKDNKVTIANGEAKTNEKGEFIIEFEATPDNDIDADTKPAFNYEVFADVTDINGETRSGQTTVKVGYVSLALTLNHEEVSKKKGKTLNVETTNLNGGFEAAKGKLIVEKLVTPKKLYRNRYWEATDNSLISEAEFNKNFSHYSYKGAESIEKAATESTLYTLDFDTKVSKSIALPNNLPVGYYRLRLESQDKDGNKIELQELLTLEPTENEAAAAAQSISVLASASSIEPGSTLTFSLKSAHKANTWVTVSSNNKELVNKIVTVNGTEKISLPVTEEMRGGIVLMLHTVINDRVFSKTLTTNVPWTNKELKFELQSFRDKLLPGENQEWKIKVTGAKKDQLLAELLASMYDASLDAFAQNYWQTAFYGAAYNASRFTNTDAFFGTTEERSVYIERANPLKETKSYLLPQLWSPNMYMFDGYGGGRRDRMMMMKSAAPMAAPPVEMMDVAAMSAKTSLKDEVANVSGARTLDSNALVASEKGANTYKSEEGKKDAPPAPPQIRTNLNETVFFFPQLQTDADGSVVLKFKMGEALTRWKLMLMAHTKDLQVGYEERTLVTQKDLMVVPNLPRFVREGDELNLSTKINNLTKSQLSGTARIELFDALTGKDLNTQFGIANASQTFQCEAEQSSQIKWTLKSPVGFTSALGVRVIAQSGNFSDGEENVLPVVTNRQLVTETLPLPVSANSTKSFNMTRIEEVSKSTTATPHRFTLEFTPNPVWYAVQALPYLMEYPYECTEQTFNRLYSNSISLNLVNKTPKIKTVFDRWRTAEPAALQSNLSKNQELKSALLAETPWVLQARSEEQQKKDIGLLFDLNRMANETESAIKKLEDRQSNNGGFAWFPGLPESEYITNYLLEGFGHLAQLGVPIFQHEKVKNMLSKAIGYSDSKMLETWNRLNAENKKDRFDAYWLYTRSFYLASNANQKQPLPSGLQVVWDHQMKQADRLWNTNLNYYQKGMIALAAHRTGNKLLADKIMESLRQQATHNPEMGMYWKYNRGYGWYDYPIETHCLLIECFAEITNDTKSVEELKTWLLKQKQTTHWPSSKATAAACNALLNQGTQWIGNEQEVKITLGGKVLDQAALKPEAGTGYIKTSYEGKAITSQMAKVDITNPNPSPAWGAMYYQYFEQLDKITAEDKGSVNIKRTMYLKKNTPTGVTLEAITAQTPIKISDLVTVRVELRSDRNLEYVHLKDSRASGFEPTSTISTHRYQQGLWYYEAPKDLGNNYFIQWLPKGTHVFEYDIRAQISGNFSGGLCTLQCMYAPEFASHSEGERLEIKN